MLFLDASKYNLSPRLFCFLAVIYTQQNIIFKWKARTGNYCNVSNGVKQGGVLSLLSLQYTLMMYYKFKKKIVALAVMLASHLSGLCLMLMI